MYLLQFRRWSLLALTLGAATLTPAAFAEQQANESPVQMTQPPVVWGLGIGAYVAQRPYTDISDKKLVFPNIFYDSKNFRIAGDTLDVKLATQDQWAFALRVRYSLLDSYRPGDAPILNGMSERNGGGWLGGAATRKTDFAKITVEALGDVSGNSKGLQAAVKFDRDFRNGSFILTPRAAIQYVDKKYVDYYFGVTSSEATSYRPAYEGASTVNLQLGLRTSYLLDKKQTISLDVSATALGNGITDSPLVDNKTTSSVAVGYLYRF